MPNLNNMKRLKSCRSDRNHDIHMTELRRNSSYLIVSTVDTNVVVPKHRMPHIFYTKRQNRAK